MRKKTKLFKQLVPPYLLLIILSIMAISWYCTKVFKDFYLENLVSNLESRSHLLESSLPRELDDNYSHVIDSLCIRLGNISKTRFTVITAEGLVIGDSHENPSVMDNHADRPEFINALHGSTGNSIRSSMTLRQTMLYVAIPVYKDNVIIGSVRSALSINNVNKKLRSINVLILIFGLFLLVLATAITFFIGKKITDPIHQMKAGAEEFAQGNLQNRLNVPNTIELASLAESLNYMASELDLRIKTIIRQREEQDTVLAGMIEGVIAVDMHERILIVNNAASKLFSVNPEAAKGKILQESVRIPDIQQFFKRIFNSEKSISEEFTLITDNERILHAHGNILLDADNSKRGAIAVFHDVTQIRRLEKARRDFVTNASHELKTPVTSIIGFVETLREGAIEKREDADRFLAIIDRQASYLTSIITDLLHLARIEKIEEENNVELEDTNLITVINGAVQSCLPQAEKKGQKIQVDCPAKLLMSINPLLMHQAVANLLDNAIKYSTNDKNIWINVSDTEKDVNISIKDEGPGIAMEHVSRIFERFYRIDKSRSRKLGGTGLGLAIVKHIALVHGGSVKLESKLLKGSTFTIVIPKDDNTIII